MLFGLGERDRPGRIRRRLAEETLYSSIFICDYSDRRRLAACRRVIKSKSVGRDSESPHGIGNTLSPPHGLHFKEGAPLRGSA